jgi:hypothetical protein
MALTLKNKLQLRAVQCAARTRMKELDQLTRHQTVERYRRLLRATTDQKRRDHLEQLIAEARQKQARENDPKYPY